MRNGNHAASLTLAAFADDTNLLGNDPTYKKSTEQLVDDTEAAFQTWDRLLHSTGHFMELGKCASYLSIWSFQEDGYAFTIPPHELNVKIEVQDIAGQPQVIPQLPTDKSQKLLGVMKNPIGNQQDEVHRLKQKSDSMIAAKINANALSYTEAKLAYGVFYLPAMRYSLAITSINQIDMEAIQKKATTALLAARGFNRHMPRDIVYGPSVYQGLEFKHLYDIQGCDATRLLLQEINTVGSRTQAMLLADLDTIQLESGIGEPILENTRALDYIEWGWIPQIREFLNHIDGKITGATPPPKKYREHDSYIMDAPELKHLTYKERLLLHRCRIYSQVETISDIADATGTQILDCWLDPYQSKPSVSTKSWPRQSDPGKVAWSIWRRTLLRSFTTSNGLLKQHLGQWIQQNEHRRHNAYFDSASDMLIYKGTSSWTSHGIKIRQRRKIYFSRAPNHPVDSVPKTACPIDILFATEEHIITSRETTLSTQQTTTQRSKPLRLNTQWQIEQHDPLLKSIRLLMDHEEITDKLQQPACIEIASDGGFNPTTGISTYGWAIAIDKILLAMGRGPAASHPALAESFRSEGYGLASVALFLHQLKQQYKFNPDQHTWKIYIDNKSLIQRMASYKNSSTHHSKWHLRPDADITNTAHSLLQPFPAEIIHVKSHQDDQTDFDKLSFAAQLNVLADAQATRQHEEMEEPLLLVLSDHRHLVLGDIFITRDTKQWILTKSGEIPIRQFYKDKYGWSQQTFDSIHWEVQKKALHSYNDRDQQRILKFVHGWLPTGKHLFREEQCESPRCLLCDALEETNDHLLDCSNDRQRASAQEIITYLWKDVHDHGDSELSNLLEMALQHSSHREWVPYPGDISPALHCCVRQQSAIGWHHLYKGRIAKGMIEYMETHYRNLQLDSKRYTGERWGKKLIQKLWDGVLKLWQQRNDMIHNATQNAGRSTTTRH
jgi:hypothetical protein